MPFWSTYIKSATSWRKKYLIIRWFARKIQHLVLLVKKKISKMFLAIKALPVMPKVVNNFVILIERNTTLKRFFYALICSSLHFKVHEKPYILGKNNS